MKSLKVLRNPKPVEVAVEVPEESFTTAQLVDSLNKAIDESLTERNKPEFKKVKGFHPSYTNQCSRYWYYMFDGVSVTPDFRACLLYTSPSPRDATLSRMPSSA